MIEETKKAAGLGEAVPSEKEEANKFKVMETKVEETMNIRIDGSEGRVFTFMMPFRTPLPECYNAAVNVANKIAAIFKEAVEKQKKQQEDKKEQE